MGLVNAMNFGVTTGTTKAEVIPAPAADTVRVFGACTVHNFDTVSHDYTLYINDGGSHTAIESSGSIATGATWKPHALNNKLLINATDLSIEIAVNAAATTNESSFFASYQDQT